MPGWLKHSDIKDRVVFPENEGLDVENAFAGTLAVGTLVYVSTVNTTAGSGLPKVTKADADGAFPANTAAYVVVEAIPQSGFGRVARSAVLYNVDTSSYSAAGDKAYLSETAGASTHAAPTNASALVQVVGFCRVKSATVGELVIDLVSNRAQAAGNTANIAEAAAGVLVAGNIGPELVLPLAITAGVTGNLDFTSLPFKFRVNRVHGVKAGAAGGGAGTVQVMNGATTDAITDAISIDVADKTVLNAGTIDDAFWSLAAGATIRVVRTRTASTNESCTLYLHGFRVA